MEETRKQFEEVFEEITGWEAEDYPNEDYVDTLWRIWQESRAAMEPVCWRTYYPDTDEDSGRAHSESGAASCAKRIASEIGGYVVPVYYGEPQQCAAGLKIKGE